MSIKYLISAILLAVLLATVGIIICNKTLKGSAVRSQVPPVANMTE
jgi:hypothetical protein